MKNTICVSLFMLATIGLFAGDWVKVKSDNPVSAEITLINSNIHSTSIQFTLGGFWKNEVETEKGLAWKISPEDGASMLELGTPDLPVFTTALLIPDQAEMKIEVISSDYIEIPDVLIAPSKGNLSRQIDPATVPYEFGKLYDVDNDFPGDISTLNEPYIIRDYRGQALRFQPFQYNPVTKVLKVYHSIRVNVVEEGVSTVNTIERTEPLTTIDSRFNAVYKRHFLNYNNSSRYDPVEEEGNMVIISYGDFIDEIEPLAEWKNQKGIPCSVVDVANIGGSAEIKQFVQNAYELYGVTFVLLVGDAAQVPSSMISGNDSDNDYTYVAGNDHYPDLFVGRFSAETETHVITMVDRTLEYETNPVTDTAWYTKAIGIASNQGPGDDNEMDYEHLRNIANNKLIPFTYNYAYELFDGSQGGEDDPGNPNPGSVSSAVNAGATIINYTGHGSTTSWGTSGFGNSHVNNLTNTGMYPFILSVACINGNFVNYTCFAEAWTRANDNGEPTGAIATLMSTVNQSWNPPMCGQDEMNDILTEAYDENIKRTFGGITMNGCMEMNDVYGSNGQSETDYWTIFGDPSVVVRTAIPADMTVSHESSVSLGETSLTVTCDADGGLAVFSFDGEILGSAVVEDGEAIIEFDPLEEIGTADVVVTAFNYRPYIGTTEIESNPEPLVVYANHNINDTKGNDNGFMDYAESIDFTVGLTNAGDEDAFGVTANLSTSSTYIEFIMSDTTYGDIVVNDTVVVVDAFSFEVAEDIPDNEVVEFLITAEDQSGRMVWQSGFNVIAHAPELVYLSYSIVDDSGDGNGRLDAGETAEITIEIANTGSADAYNVIGELAIESDYVHVYNNQQQLGDLLAETESQLTFQVFADGDTPEGYQAIFIFNMMGDHNISGGDDFYTFIGQKPVYIMNLSAGRSSSDSLVNCMNTLQVNVDSGNEMPDDVELYHSIFVVLGMYPDNYELTQQQGEELAAYLESGGCIYMEGGNAWTPTDPTSVHPMFYISGLEDGEDDLTMIIGEKNGFLSGYSFEYNGLNNSIDRIEAMEGATLLMSNNDPDYGVAVSYFSDIYKTVGTSFSFAGLVDESGSTKDGMIAEILNFFEIGFTWTDVTERYVSDIDVVAYPNPFNEQVTFEVMLKDKAKVSLFIYDLTGRNVKTIVEKDLQGGDHRFTWDASDMFGNKIQPGVYFYSLRIGDQVSSGKLVLSH